MIEAPNILDPRPIKQAEIRVRYNYAYLDERKPEPTFTVENVRFEHDPHWRERFWSLENARSQRGTWGAVSAAFQVAQIAWPVAFMTNC